MTIGHLHPSTIPVQPTAEEISRFCEKWGIAELALFGSALHHDFNSSSDINLLVTPGHGSSYGLFDIARMEDELTLMFGRTAMVLTRKGVELSSNPIRRREILDSAEVIYAKR